MNGDLRRPHCGDDGSGSIWILTVAMVVMAATVIVGAFSQIYGARVRAAAAADAAALAGAVHVLQGRSAACDSARDLAVRNNARLTRCVVEGADVQVIVVVHLGGVMNVAGDVAAQARARMESVR